ncbi:hypothetical protein GPA23_02940 [Aromatoleum aromaticum]|nr:hypothetical protein [Aromatoleum aromaticum]
MDCGNPAECLDLLKRLRMLDIDATQRTLADIVAALLRALPAPNQHLEVLEAARAQVDFVQAEMAKRYAAHPLPPDSSENETLARVVSLWRGMARSYAQISRQDAASGTLDDQRALLAQRRVDYTGRALLEYFRAHRAPPHGTWAELHDSYSVAEARGVAGVRVPDSLNEVWKAQSALEAYVSALLVDLANPFGRGEREFRWVYRWAQRFAPYCSLDAEPDTGRTEAAAFGIDLAGDHGPRPLWLIGPPGAGVRRFDASRLAGQIRAVLTQFRQGVAPASLGLGADCPTDACAALLLSLYRPWGLASAARRFPRRSGKGSAELCGDWLTIGFHIGGRTFEQPTGGVMAGNLARDISLLTFGERGPEAVPGRPEQLRQRLAATLGFVCGHWDIVDHSVNGFRLQQHPHTERLEHHQLVGIRPPDGERFLLGQVTWLMYREDGVMEAGIHVLAGLPKVVAARLFGLNIGTHVAYQQVFLLPATPALKAPALLVLPGGWFQARRVIEVHDDEAAQVRLTGLLARGTNFDQVSFEALTDPARDAPQETGH